MSGAGRRGGVAVPSVGRDPDAPGAELFAVLADNLLGDAVVTLDAAGTVASWNRGAERVAGFSAAEIVGRHFGVLYCDEDRVKGRPEAELAEARASGPVRRRGWRVRGDGSWFPAAEVMTALRDRSGGVRGYLVVIRDDTSEDRRLRESAGAELADTVVRRLFEAGLGLQATLSLIDHPAARARVEEVVEGLDLTIREIRSVILDLRC